MATKIEVIRKTNSVFVQLIQDLSIEKLNAIPTGFSNNIIWNFAHLLAMQQGYFYELSGLPYTIPKEFVDTYKKGTAPLTFLNENQVGEIVNMFTGAINKLEHDYESGIFKKYDNYTTSIGFTITNIEDALLVSSFHDGWHFGVAKTIKKLL